MYNKDNKEILSTVFSLYTAIMIAVTEDVTLGTVGKEYENNIDVADSSANILALKLNKKV